MSVEFIGPCHVRADVYQFSVDGCRVPNLVGYKTGENQWELVLRRDGFDTYIYEGFTSAQILVTVPLVAQAMALSAGWSSFGKNGTKENDFKCGVVELGDMS